MDLGCLNWFLPAVLINIFVWGLTICWKRCRSQSMRKLMLTCRDSRQQKHVSDFALCAIITGLFCLVTADRRRGFCIVMYWPSIKAIKRFYRLILLCWPLKLTGELVWCYEPPGNNFRSAAPLYAYNLGSQTKHLVCTNCLLQTQKRTFSGSCLQLLHKHYHWGKWCLQCFSSGTTGMARTEHESCPVIARLRRSRERELWITAALLRLPIRTPPVPIRRLKVPS